MIQYKASVQALIPIYENNLKTAMEALVKRKKLLAHGLVSKRDIDAGEQAVKDAQTQLDQTRQQLTESDQLIAEANAESIKPPGAVPTGRYTSNAAVMRYNGATGWSITRHQRWKASSHRSSAGNFRSARSVSRRLITVWDSIIETQSMSRCVLTAPRAKL